MTTHTSPTAAEDAAASCDRDFDRKMLLARLRWNLLCRCPIAANQLRREGIDVRPDGLSDQLLFRVANARPRSAIVPWHVPDDAVLAMIPLVVREFLSEDIEAPHEAPAA